MRLLFFFLCAALGPALASAQVAVTLPDLELAAHATGVLVPIETADVSGQGVTSLDFTIHYNASLITVTGIHTDGTLSASMAKAVNTNTAGVLRVSAASADALEGAGVLMYLIVDYVKQGETPLVWKKMQYNEGAPAVTLSDGRIGAGVALPAEKEEAPTGFSLGKNFPNPFGQAGTATVIPYVLDEPTPVHLHLFDVLGRPVRTLVQATQPAGAHKATLQVDGLTDGVYFYRLVTPQGTQVRKLLVVR